MTNSKILIFWFCVLLSNIFLFTRNSIADDRRYIFASGIGAWGNDLNIYTVNAIGQLMLAHHSLSIDGTGTLTDSKTVGYGWNDFSHIFPAYDGLIYAINPDGDLFWYQHLGHLQGKNHWHESSGTKISSGWDTYTSVFSQGSGLIYAVDVAGVLWRYRHAGYFRGEDSWGYADRTKTSSNYIPERIGTGWGHFTRMISSDNSKVWGISQSGKYYQFDFRDAKKWDLSLNEVKRHLKFEWPVLPRTTTFPGGSSHFYAIKSNGKIYVRGTGEKDQPNLLKVDTRLGTGEPSLEQSQYNWFHKLNSDGTTKSPLPRNVIVFVRHARNESDSPWNLIRGTRRIICKNFDHWEETWGKTFSTPHDGITTAKISYLNPAHEEDLPFKETPKTNRFRETANAIHHGMFPNTFGLSDDALVKPFDIPIATGMSRLIKNKDARLLLLVGKQYPGVVNLTEQVNEYNDTRVHAFVLSRSVFKDLTLLIKNRSAFRKPGYMIQQEFCNLINSEYLKSKENHNQDYFYNNYWVIYRYGTRWVSYQTFSLESDDILPNSIQDCENIPYLQ